MHEAELSMHVRHYQSRRRRSSGEIQVGIVLSPEYKSLAGDLYSSSDVKLTAFGDLVDGCCPLATLTSNPTSRMRAIANRPINREKRIEVSSICIFSNSQRSLNTLVSQ